MKYTQELQKCCTVSACNINALSPIPQEGAFTEAKEIRHISGFSHSVGTCGLRQGACKLSLNIKDGIIQEALIEVIGCSGMTQSAAIAAETLPGKTLLEALNTDLACDAIHVAMREFFLAMAYGRTQTAYSLEGLPIGSSLLDLGKGTRSQVGTSFGTLLKGPRYLEVSDGYVTRLGLDENNSIIGYEAVNLSLFMDKVQNGISPNQALNESTSTFGRYHEATIHINPRKE